MNYEQTKNKIRTIWNQNQENSHGLLIKQQTDLPSINSDSVMKRIIPLNDTDWVIATVSVVSNDTVLIGI